MISLLAANLEAAVIRRGLDSPSVNVIVIAHDDSASVRFSIAITPASGSVPSTLTVKKPGFN
jgi:hypothetical protein